MLGCPVWPQVELQVIWLICQACPGRSFGGQGQGGWGAPRGRQAAGDFCLGKCSEAPGAVPRAGMVKGGPAQP